MRGINFLGNLGMLNILVQDKKDETTGVSILKGIAKLHGGLFQEVLFSVT